VDLHLECEVVGVCKGTLPLHVAMKEELRQTHHAWEAVVAESGSGLDVLEGHGYAH
jgi:hypothetical protein